MGVQVRSNANPETCSNEIFSFRHEDIVREFPEFAWIKNANLRAMRWLLRHLSFKCFGLFNEVIKSDNRK